MALLVRIVLLSLIALTGYSIAVNAEGGVLGFSAGPVHIYAFDLLLLAAIVLLLREATLKHGQPIPSANRTVIALVGWSAPGLMEAVSFRKLAFTFRSCSA